MDVLSVIEFSQYLHSALKDKCCRGEPGFIIHSDLGSPEQG